MNKTQSSSSKMKSLTILLLACSMLLITLLTFAATKTASAQMAATACWQFEGNLNATTQAAYNGIAFGNATTTAANASPAGGQSLLLDGDVDYLTVGNPIPQTGSYSKTMWVYRVGLNNAGDWENLFTSGDPGGAHALLIDTSTNPADGLVVYHRGNGGGADHHFTGQAMPTGQWVHLAVVYDATAQTLVTYYNGIAIDTQANMPALGTITDPDNIGAYAGMQSYWNGQLDDVCVFGSALSTTQIMAMVNPPSAGIVVNTLSDTGAAGICTLTDAVEAANTDAAVNGCAAGNGADNITFSVAGTISPALDYFIDSDISIEGGNTIVLDGGSSTRLFTVASGTARVAGVTVQNGVGFAECERDFPAGFYDCGGALFVEAGAMATVDNSVLTGNTVGVNGEGGAIYNLGTVTILNSTLSNNSGDTADNDSFSRGGALANFGTATIRNSSVTGNMAYDGGAVNNRGNAALLTISNSTFSSNVATGNGGGIYNADEAGGSRVVNIDNSTFSGNTAPTSAGGGIINYETVTIINSTFSANAGGGIYNGGTANISNSIFANSSMGGDCDNLVPNGTINLTGNNLIEDNSCGATGGSDPNLAALAANSCTTHHMTASGSACVMTHALNTGSAAIGGGNAGICSAAPIGNLDQRGISRADDNAPCDIGAYEVDGTATAVKLFLPYIESGSTVRAGLVTAGSGLSIVTAGLIVGRRWLE